MTTAGARELAGFADHMGQQGQGVMVGCARRGLIERQTPAVLAESRASPRGHYLPYALDPDRADRLWTLSETLLAHRETT